MKEKTRVVESAEEMVITQDKRSLTLQRNRLKTDGLIQKICNNDVAKMKTIIYHMIFDV